MMYRDRAIGRTQPGTREILRRSLRLVVIERPRAFRPSGLRSCDPRPILQRTCIGRIISMVRFTRKRLGGCASILGPARFEGYGQLERIAANVSLVRRRKIIELSPQIGHANRKQGCNVIADYPVVYSCSASDPGYGPLGVSRFRRIMSSTIGSDLLSVNKWTPRSRR